MKKHLPNSKSLWAATLILFFALSSAVSQTPINNGSFETWEDVPIAFVPDNWEVERDHETADLINTRMNESTEGTYSIKLTTIIDEDLDPNRGYAVLGELDDEGIPVGGIELAEDVDELRFDVKYSTQIADPVMVIVQIFDAAGDEIGGGSQTFTESGITDESIALT
jgi:hypothetical protein